MSTQPDKGTVQETVVTTPETSPMTYDNRKGRRKRRMRVLMGVLGLIFLLKLGGVGWFTSPYGATALTTLAVIVFDFFSA